MGYWQVVDKPVFFLRLRNISSLSANPPEVGPPTVMNTGVFEPNVSLGRIRGTSGTQMTWNEVGALCKRFSY